MPGLRRTTGSATPSTEVCHLDLPLPGSPDRPQRIEYRVVRSARRRRTIEVSVHAGAVTVRAPLRTSRAEIEQVVRHRARWILRRCAESPGPAALEAGTPIPYRGHPLALLVETAPEPHAGVRLGLFGLHVRRPAGDGREQRTEATRDALVAWMRDRAVELIPPRVEHWAARTGWRPSRVLVRDQRRRWGSCAADGTLRFNWRLVMLDGDLLDYLVVHELAHLRHPHHRHAFWRAVEAHVPDHAALRRRLRQEGPRLPL